MSGAPPFGLLRIASDEVPTIAGASRELYCEARVIARDAALSLCGGRGHRTPRAFGGGADSYAVCANLFRNFSIAARAIYLADCVRRGRFAAKAARPPRHESEVREIPMRSEALQFIDLCVISLPDIAYLRRGAN